MDARAALLEGVFDHAGMFPPASKSFEEALKDAADFEEDLAEPGLLGADMVLNKADLDLLTDEALEAAGWSPERECQVCLVGIPIAHAEDAARLVTAWNEEGSQADYPRFITALEMTFDDTLKDGPGAIAATLAVARHLMRDSEVYLYIEPRWTEAQWADSGLERMMTLLDAINEDTELPPVGLKVRCAGPTALGPETLAAILPAMSNYGIPFKATQGLHHAVVDPAHGNTAGFLGLAVGLRLAQSKGLAGAELAACIGETDASAFGFSGGVSWRNHKMGLGDLGLASVEVPFSIGSCSITEPDEELGLLD